MRVLAVDVGGRHVKALAQGEAERRRFKSGPDLTPEHMVAGTLELVEGWHFDRVSIGIPAPVTADVVEREPVNLGSGWKGFDFEAAFGRPTKVVNDAVMQAIGSYEGGRMLYLGLGTGLGSTMIVDDTIVPMELAHLPFRRATFEDYVGRAGRARLGPKRWREAVLKTVEHLSRALLPDYVVLGGGLADELAGLPANVRVGGNELAFLGGFRLWD
jgi:polyphosphate glucokinase